MVRRLVEKSQRGSEESSIAKWTLTALALGFVFIFLFLPLVNVFYQAFSHGVRAYIDAIKEPDSMAAIKLTLLVAAISVPCNVIFGLAASWTIAKFDFPGKSLIITLIDLPFAISPVVAGLMFFVLFGRQDYLGEWLDDRDIKIIFAPPIIII